MARPKQPDPVFEVVFEGKDIYPEAIPLGVLTRTLSAVRRLAAGSEFPDEEEEESLTDEGSIRLVKVKRGSAVFQFFAPSAASDLARLRSAGAVLQTPELVAQNDYMLRPIELLSKTADRLKCSVVVREVGDDQAILATIEPATYQRLSQRLFLEGETSLTGRVERVGGATAMRCALRVAFQPRLLFCRVANDDVARQLGNYLYQDVAVTGNARWLKSNWKVVGFTVHSAYQPQAGPLAEAFQALYDAGGHGWDGVSDPKALLDEVCGK
jgi:hypothetical protein